MIKKTSFPKALLNRDIPFDQFMVIDQNGNSLGVLSKLEALRQAQAANLDLMLVSDNQANPICRILDFGKYQYQRQKSLKKQRKKKNINVVKEIRFSASIAENDLKLRIKKAIVFLQKQYTLKITMFLRGREKFIANYGFPKFTFFLDQLKSYGTTDKLPKRKFNFYFAQLKPKSASSNPPPTTKN